MLHAAGEAQWCALVVLSFSLGSGPLMTTTSALPETLAELPAWLEAREAAVDDLREGTDKRIVWHEGAIERRPLALVYLHGFSASRQETRPLADQVAHSLGANLYYARLTGHGRTGAALAQATVDDWFEDGREALAIASRLGEEVVIMACSTGATLTTAMAMAGELDGLPVKALVFVSPNFGIARRSARVFLLPFGDLIARLVGGAEQEFTPENDAHARYWTIRYPTSAVGTMMRLLRRVERGDPSTVTMPVLSFFSPADEVLHVPSLMSLHRRFPNARNQLQRVDNAGDGSKHVIAGDALSPQTTGQVAEQTREFLLSLDQAPPA